MNYVLKLYIAGNTAHSLRAIKNLELICKEFKLTDCEIEIIDVFDNIKRAEEDKIIAVPTLVKHSPPPMQKFIGDLSDFNKVCLALNLTID